MDFGDEGDIIADGDLPGPGSLELSARNMAEEDGLRSDDMWKRVPVWTVWVGRRTTVVMVMRKLVNIEDVKMADARNEEGGDRDEEDHGKEDGSDGDSEDDDANSTASSTTFNIFAPSPGSPHLPRPVPTLFLHASLHTPKPQPPKVLPSSLPSVSTLAFLSPTEPLPTLPSNLLISSYTLSNLSLPGSAAVAAHAGSSTPRDQTLQTVFLLWARHERADWSQAQMQDFVKVFGLGRSWPLWRL